MSNLIHPATKEYPVEFDEFRRRFQDTSFSDPINYSAFGYEIVRDALHPEYTRLQRAKELPPVLVDGAWQQVWVVVDLRDEMTPEEYEIFLKSLADQDAKAASDKAKAELLLIDAASIRSLREYIASKADAPEFVKKHEAEAIKARKDVIKEK